MLIRPERSKSVSMGKAGPSGGPDTRPMPTTGTAGRNAEARNGENRPMRAPDQRLGQMSINPGKTAGRK